MRHLLLGAILISPLAWASDASDWKPLDQVLAEFQSSNDPSNLSYLIGRCAGVYLSVAKSSETRAKSADIGKQYLNVATQFMNFFSVANLQIRGLNASEANLASQVETDRKTITVFANGYMDRINYNYTTTGNHFAEDPFMRQELMTCKTVAEALLQ